MSTMQVLAVRRSRPDFIVPIAAVIFMLFGIGPNYELALLVCVVLIVGVYLLWRPGEAQILLFLFGFQWLQVAMFIFYANLRGVTLVEFMEGYPGIEYAITLAAIGLLALVIGIRIGTGSQQASYLIAIRNSINRTPATRWLNLHIVMLGVSSLSLVLARWVPGLSQPLLGLANLKWGTFLIFTIVTFAKPGGPRRIWLVLFGLEFVLSLGGYFSSFKSVFLYTLIAITALGTRITPKQVLSGLTVTVLMLVAGLYWTAIKTEYRTYIAGGQVTQAVVVGYGEAVRKLVELVGGVESTQLVKAADVLAHRFSEIDIFSAVVTYVPRVRGHEWGKLWLDAISRPFMPRMFVPNKAAIDESMLTNYYTGLGLAGAAQGTQVSMGYIADSYIDFGEIGMMPTLLGFGFFLGYLYRWFLHHPRGGGLLWCGLAPATLIQAASIGTSSSKLFGGIFACALAAVLFVKFVSPRYLSSLQGLDHDVCSSRLKRRP